MADQIDTCENCDCECGEDVHVFCLVRGEEDMLLCSDCWVSFKKEWKAEGWVDADNNEDEDEEDTPPETDADGHDIKCCWCNATCPDVRYKDGWAHKECLDKEDEEDGE